jgi:hypothetical protein
VGGVGDGAAEDARVEIPAGGAQAHVEGHEPPHPGRDRRHGGRPHAGVGDDHHVAGQPFPLGIEQRLEVGAPDLLLSLHQDFHVDRHRSGPGSAEEAPDRLEVAEHLALVVAGSPAEHAAGPHGGLERRRVPLVERIDRLDVVMAVDQGREGAVGVEPVAVHGGLAGGGQDLDVLESGGGHPLGAPLGRGGDVAVVDGLRADGRDPHPAGQRLEHLGPFGGEEVAQERARAWAPPVEHGT